MARLAAIDLGSNAIRLRIVDVDPPRDTPDGPRFYAFREVSADRASVRLGHDVFTRGEIEPSVIAAACDALKRFRGAMDAAKVDRYRAVATSAAREAKNGDLLVERAQREAGVHIEIIEGIEEARLVQLAVSERVALGNRRAVLVDIGGGSTELTVLRDRRAEYSRSLPVGTVRLVEAFLDARGPVDDVRRTLIGEYVERACDEAVREIRELAGEGSVDLLIGTGGNIETLADLCPVPGAFPEGRAIHAASMARLLDELCASGVDERVARWGLRPDRADTIVPAASVLGWLARAFGLASISAPGVGLKEGVLVDLARAHFFPGGFSGEAAAILDACLRLGRRYRFDEPHGMLVSRLTTRLFDDLAPRHRMGPRDRILISAAALLHDVGDFVRYEGHHKHGYYLLVHSDIMGLSREELDVVANVARYHRKSTPSLEHENFRALDRDARAKVKAMAAILRIADALDREHRGKVADVSGRVEGGTLVLEVQGADEYALEEWTVRQKSGMLREAFGLEVRLADVRRAASAGPPSSQRSATTPPRDERG
jgi:exopolyphosphatase/guanosine-5'-triphosphate,3'-diphosphate pyrophosphatase